MKSRLPALDEARLSERQRSVLEDIRTGPRGNLSGPFMAWIRSPDLAQHAQQLGAYCRFQTSLSPRLSELAILITASWWQSQSEWIIHAPIAIEAGLSPTICDALKAGIEPAFDRDDERLVYQVGSAIYQRKRLDDDLYHAAIAALGERTLVELVGVFGYYALVSMTLNVFEILPDNTEELPFDRD